MARHVPPGSLTLAALAERCGAALDGDGSVRISHVGTLESAEPGAIAFLANPKYAAQLGATRASAVIVSPSDARHTTLPKLVSPHPYLTYARVAAVLHPAPVPAPVPADPEAWVAAAEGSSPAILQAKKAVEIAELETEKAKAGHKPTLDLTSSYGITRNPGGRGACGMALTSVGSALAAVSQRMVNQNVEPQPGLLKTPISPPIRCASSLQMASPSPVPPYLRAVEVSACAKG